MPSRLYPCCKLYQEEGGVPCEWWRSVGLEDDGQVSSWTDADCPLARNKHRSMPITLLQCRCVRAYDGKGSVQVGDQPHAKVVTVDFREE